MYKAIDRWFPGYIKSVLARRHFAGTKHLYFAIADHFEPLRGGTSTADARKNVAEWLARYERHFDSVRAVNGSRPKQTLFYPAEEYDPAIIDMLAGFRDRGHGDVEIHLHHRNDTEDGLRTKLVEFKDKLFYQHGLLRKEEYLATRAPALDAPQTFQARPVLGKLAHPVQPDKDSTSLINQPLAEDGIRQEQVVLASSVGVEAGGPGGKNGSSIIYGFVHGNWALCNSRPDGDWCGVDNEIAVLKETGCYADFTFPSAPSPTQPQVVNQIYYARNREEVQGARCKVVSAKSHDCPADLSLNFKPLTCNTHQSSSDLMLITGPLTLDWRKRKYGFLPGLENGSLDGVNPASPHRADIWAGCNIHVEGRPDHVFVKVHTHGLVPSNADALFGGRLLDTYRHMLRQYDDGSNWQLHFVTCFEMYEAIRGLQEGIVDLRTMADAVDSYRGRGGGIERSVEGSSLFSVE